MKNDAPKFEHFNKKEILSKLLPLIENTAMRNNLIPIEIDFQKENHHWMLRIFIYSNDHPINHKDCENMTRGLGDFLDELIPFNYYLEVSSPGLDRKLKTFKEFIIFKGKNISLKVKNEIEEEKQFNATILDFDENEGLKVLKLNSNNIILINKDDIVNARLCIE